MLSHTQKNIWKGFLLFLLLAGQVWAVQGFSYDEAVSLFYQKRYPQVEAFFEEYLIQNPENDDAAVFYAESAEHNLIAKTNLDKAVLLAEKNRFSQAFELIDAAQIASPYYPGIAELRRDLQEKEKKNKPYEGLSQAEKNIVLQLIEEGKAFLAQGKNEEALRTFARAIEMAPKSPEASEGYNEANQRYSADQLSGRLEKLFLEVKSLENSGRYIEALARYEEILKLNPGNEIALVRQYELKTIVRQQREEASRKELAQEYYSSAQGLRKGKKFDEAIEQFDMGKNISPKLYDWDTLIAQTKQEKEGYERELFEKEMEQLSKVYNQGLYQLTTEKYREAVSSFEEAMSIARKYKDEELIRQSSELHKTARENMELLEAEIVPEDSPYSDFVQTLIQQGLQAYQDKRYEESKIFFNEIKNIFPRNRIANKYFLAANIMQKPEAREEILGTLISQAQTFRKTNPPEAKRIINLAYEIAPEDEKINSLRKEILEGSTTVPKRNSGISQAKLDEMYSDAFRIYQSEPQRALQIAQSILDADPQNVKARILMARIRGRSTAATASPTDVIPPAAREAYSLGIVQYNNQDMEGAVRSFQLALRLAPNYAQARSALMRTQQYMRSK